MQRKMPCTCEQSGRTGPRDQLNSVRQVEFVFIQRSMLGPAGSLSFHKKQNMNREACVDVPPPGRHEQTAINQSFLLLYLLHVYSEQIELVAADQRVPEKCVGVQNTQIHRRLHQLVPVKNAVARVEVVSVIRVVIVGRFVIFSDSAAAAVAAAAALTVKSVIR